MGGGERELAWGAEASKGEVGGQARGPGGGGEESGAQVSREGWVLGVRCLEVLNRWSLKCPVEESSRPASKGRERKGWSRASPQGVRACWKVRP